jgi:hypothetical protein
MAVIARAAAGGGGGKGNALAVGRGNFPFPHTPRLPAQPQRPARTRAGRFCGRRRSLAPGA